MATLRVLLVEDKGPIRLMTAEALQEAGFRVVEAWDEDEAIRLLDGPDGFDAGSPVPATDVRPADRPVAYYLPLPKPLPSCSPRVGDPR